MMAKEPDGSKKHIFRPINARYQTLKEGKLSYSAVRNIVLGLFKHVVDDTSLHGVTVLLATYLAITIMAV